MKILLINSNRELSPFPVPPTGLCNVANALVSSGFDVRLLDLTFSGRPGYDISSAMRLFEPDAVGVSIRNIDDADSRRRRFYLEEIRKEVIDVVKSVAPGIPIVIGGSAVGISPIDISRHLGVRIAAVGDGEATAPEVFSSIGDGSKNRVDQSQVMVTESHMQNLDALPFSSAWRWLDVKKYELFGSAYGIQTKRGCDRSCVYCSYPGIEGGSFRLIDPVRVADEIQEAYEKGGVRYFEFVDAVFNLPRAHTLAVLKEIAGRKIPVALDAMSLNPAAVDCELVEAMLEAGFVEVSCTPESGSDMVLRNLRKGFTTESASLASLALREAGLPSKWYFLFGGPGETEVTVRETFDFIDAMIPRRDLIIAMTGIRVLPGTHLAKLLEKEGALPAGDLISPFYYYGEAGRERLISIVEREGKKRVNFCHVSGEAWSSPFLVRAVNTFWRFAGRKYDSLHPRWEIIAFFKKILRYAS